jgi:hypothetical protein
MHEKTMAPWHLLHRKRRTDPLFLVGLGFGLVIGLLIGWVLRMLYRHYVLGG